MWISKNRKVLSRPTKSCSLAPTPLTQSPWWKHMLTTHKHSSMRLWRRWKGWETLNLLRALKERSGWIVGWWIPILDSMMRLKSLISLVCENNDSVCGCQICVTINKAVSRCYLEHCTIDQSVVLSFIRRSLKWFFSNLILSWYLFSTKTVCYLKNMTWHIFFNFFFFTLARFLKSSND